MDSQPSPTATYGRARIDQNFQSLVRPSDIDGSFFRRNPQSDAAPDTCDNVLIFLPYSFGHNGIASQLNNYLLAAMIATFTNRSMVVLEPPNSQNVFKSNSQFGCPPEVRRPKKKVLRFVPTHLIVSFVHTGMEDGRQANKRGA